MTTVTTRGRVLCARSSGAGYSGDVTGQARHNVAEWTNLSLTSVRGKCRSGPVVKSTKSPVSSDNKSGVTLRLSTSARESDADMESVTELLVCTSAE